MNPGEQAARYVRNIGNDVASKSKSNARSTRKPRALLLMVESISQPRVCSGTPRNGQSQSQSPPISSNSCALLVAVVDDKNKAA